MVFTQTKIEAFHPLSFEIERSILDRDIAIIKEIQKRMEMTIFIDYNTGYDCYCINKLCDDFFLNISIPEENTNFNYNENTLIYKTTHELYEDETYEKDLLSCVFRCELNKSPVEITKGYGIFITTNVCSSSFYACYKISNFRYISVHKDLDRKFNIAFHKFIDKDNFYFDNLINLCVMVKNGGELFKKMLNENLPFIDRYTILDTGSTDGTQDNIREILKDKEGNLYEEPFINFRDSRNRLLDLAGNDYVFNVMLDDTYVLKGSIRETLFFFRSTRHSSLSVIVNSTDLHYASCRITRSQKKYRYKYRLHEIIDSGDEKSILLPDYSIYIEDYADEYMNNRTLERKKYDLQILFEDLKEYDNDPRVIYYIAETYLCMKDYENAVKYYNLRAETKDTENAGYGDEIQDALYKSAVLSKDHLNAPWDKSLIALLNTYEYDKKRPDALFVIGLEYENRNEKLLAYNFMKSSFMLGSNPPIQMNKKVDMYNRHIPEYLIPYCYHFKDYQCGYEASVRRLRYEKFKDINERNKYVNWKNAFTLLLEGQQRIDEIVEKNLKVKDEKPLFIFLTAGGWSPWNGKSLETKGLGGSETCIIKYAELVAKMNKFEVLVVCNCDEEIVHNNVKYISLNRIYELFTHNIECVFIHRYTEYIPLFTRNNIKTLFCAHDLFRSGELIVQDDYLLKTFALSEFHKKAMDEEFPLLSNISNILHYGISVDDYSPKKIKNSFIYSSFPNRGLIILLKLFPKIIEKYPSATLNIYCDFDNEWTKNFYSKELDLMKEIINSSENIINHGWVNKETLTKAWNSAEYWFYPCIFAETCCLTALEAGASKTLAISNHLGALSETIGDRGLIIEGDAYTDEWQEKALEKVLDIMDDDNSESMELKQSLIDKNYEYILNERNFEKVLGDFLKKI